MSKTTANLGLIKPELTDPADITIMNSNWDVIDAAIEECAAEIPVTSEVPEDATIWIDPDDDTIEENHLTDTKNPHNVTAAQVGAMEMTLLWTNASFSSNFAAQTIALDLSGYDAVMITASSEATSFIPVGDQGAITTWNGYYICRRTVYTSVDGVNFSSATTWSQYGNNVNGAENPSWQCRPYKIYGFKGVKK